MTHCEINLVGVDADFQNVFLLICRPLAEDDTGVLADDLGTTYFSDSDDDPSDGTRAPQVSPVLGGRRWRRRDVRSVHGEDDSCRGRTRLHSYHGLPREQ
jgi:hypothetical protein